MLIPPSISYTQSTDQVFQIIHSQLCPNSALLIMHSLVYQKPLLLCNDWLCAIRKRLLRWQLESVLPWSMIVLTSGCTPILCVSKNIYPSNLCICTYIDAEEWLVVLSHGQNWLVNEQPLPMFLAHFFSKSKYSKEHQGDATRIQEETKTPFGNEMKAKQEA